ncbi:MAG TPA: hypothetical protein VGA69_00170 [Nitriliruptorales bacterium]
MAAPFSVLATLVSSVFAVALLRRWWGARRSRALLWWGLSIGMFAVASLMLAVGALGTWTSASWRTFYLFGAVLNVPWLALGSVTVNRRAPIVERITGAGALVVGLLFLLPALDGSELALPGAILGIGWGLALLVAGPSALEPLSIALVLAFTLLALAQVPGAVLSAPLPSDAMPEGRELFPLHVRGLAVGGNAVGAVMVIVSAAASAVNLAWGKPPRGALARARAQAERGLTDVVARWLFQGRRGVVTTVNFVRGNLLIAAGVTVAGAGGAIGGIEGHSVGLGVGVTLMYLGFSITTRPVGEAG